MSLPVQQQYKDDVLALVGDLLLKAETVVEILEILGEVKLVISDLSTKDTFAITTSADSLYLKLLAISVAKLETGEISHKLVIGTLELSVMLVQECLKTILDDK